MTREEEEEEGGGGGENYKKVPTREARPNLTRPEEKSRRGIPSPAGKYTTMAVLCELKRNLSSLE